MLNVLHKKYIRLVGRGGEREREQVILVFESDRQSFASFTNNWFIIDTTNTVAV